MYTPNSRGDSEQTSSLFDHPFLGSKPCWYWWISEGLWVNFLWDLFSIWKILSSVFPPSQHSRSTIVLPVCCRSERPAVISLDVCIVLCRWMSVSECSIYTTVSKSCCRKRIFHCDYTTDFQRRFLLGPRIRFHTWLWNQIELVISGYS